MQLRLQEFLISPLSRSKTSQHTLSCVRSRENARQFIARDDRVRMIGKINRRERVERLDERTASEKRSGGCKGG